MDNRDRDKINKPTDVKQKSGSTNFGEKMGRSENIEDIHSDSGRSSGSSGIGEVDRGDLNKKSGNRSGNSSESL
jgi:hypothetical protein